MATSTTRQMDQHAHGDDLDELFNYDLPTGDRPHDAANSNNSNNGRPTGTKSAADLGIDEEVTISTKRRPIPKLDDNRLLSAAGIPKLRRISKERLRLKGKGHEFSDVARLLNMYQLWLDDLYPRAKFADGLAIIEKLGHSKRIQMMRREWINEGKPKPTIETEETNEEPNGAQQEGQHPAADDDDLFDAPDTDLVQRSDQSNQADERLGEPQNSGPESVAQAKEHETEEPDEDELDALLAEDESLGQPANRKEPEQGAGFPRSTMPKPTEEDPFADEMEAMEGLDDW